MEILRAPPLAPRDEDMPASWVNEDFQYTDKNHEAFEENGFFVAEKFLTPTALKFLRFVPKNLEC